MKENTMVHDTLYKQVRTEILKIIIEKNIKPKEALPSESEISKLCGVSKMTSKLALNLLVEEGIINRIPRRGSFLNNIDMKLIESMVGDNGSSYKDLTKDTFIALVVPAIDPYIGDIITGIEQQATLRKLNVVLKLSRNSKAEEERIISEISSMPDIKGMILFPGDSNICGPELLKLKLNDYPIVIIDRVFKEVLFDSVFHDFNHGTREIVNYLVDNGHNNIGYISRDISNVTSTEEKYQGYISGMMENSKLIKNEAIRFIDKLLNTRDFEEYLVTNREITAVVCSDDYIATKLYQVAIGQGIRVPEELSITGFSDNSFLKYLPIEMTTISQPVEELCTMAVELLENRLLHGEALSKVVRIKTEIVKRNSVANILGGK